MTNRKTNAMRILDRKNVHYELLTYDKKDDRIDGISVSEKIGKDERTVFKTLVVQGTSGQLYVFIIPVAEELDLKKAAKVAGEKKVDMIPVKDLVKWTGYVRGGCSPIGMKKLYPTFIDQSASSLQSIVVSGGKIGMQIELSPDDLRETIKGEFAPLVKCE